MKKTIAWVGRVLMVVSTVFIVVKLWGWRDTLVGTLKQGNIVVYLICILAWGVVLAVVLHNPFRWMVDLFSKRKIPYIKVQYLYCKSNLYKYLPGNVMHYIGRNQLAVEENISHKDVAFASVAEVLITGASSALVISFFSFQYAVEWINDKLSWHFILLIFAGAAIILITVLVLFHKKVCNFLKPFWLFFTPSGLKTAALSTLVVASSLMFNSLIFLEVLKTLGGNIPSEKWPIAIGLCSLAWFLGFITPGAPGGMGIREAVLSYFFIAYLSPDIVVVGAVVFRIITTLGDFVGYLIALCVLEIEKIKKGRLKQRDNKN